jgi:hypothetical protein
MRLYDLGLVLFAVVIVAALVAAGVATQVAR